MQEKEREKQNEREKKEEKEADEREKVRLAQEKEDRKEIERNEREIESATNHSPVSPEKEKEIDEQKEDLLTECQKEARVTWNSLENIDSVPQLWRTLEDMYPPHVLKRVVHAHVVRERSNPRRAARFIKELIVRLRFVRWSSSSRSSSSSSSSSSRSSRSSSRVRLAEDDIERGARNDGDGRLGGVWYGDEYWPEVGWGLKNNFNIHSDASDRKRYGYSIGDACCPFRIVWEDGRGYFVIAIMDIAEGCIVTWYDGRCFNTQPHKMSKTLLSLGLGSHVQYVFGSGCMRVDGKGLTPLDLDCGAFSFMNSPAEGEVANIQIEYKVAAPARGYGLHEHAPTRGTKMYLAKAKCDIKSGSELLYQYDWRRHDEMKFDEIVGNKHD